MAILVIAEHDNQQLKPDTARLIQAASALADEIDILVAGAGCAGVAEAAAKLRGVRQVLLADNPAYQAQMADSLSALVLAHVADYRQLLAATSALGKELLPRVAALLDVEMISGVVKIITPDSFVRPVYAGDALETVRSLAAKTLLTVRTSAFDAVAADGQANIQPLTDVFPSRCKELGRSVTVSARPELGSARVVVSGGRALGSADNFALLEQLADKLGAAVGASRAAVDAGYIGNEFQVGQTGKIVAPELYIAVGISGAIQHLAGMKDSKVIVAINKDPQAPIFQVADYGLQADLFEVVPKLTQLI